MIKFLVKKTIKNYQDTENSQVREKYGVLSGVLGIICNLFLCSLKLIIGFIMSSMAIISDGINNLSDSGSSIISIFSAKLSNKKPDKDQNMPIVPTIPIKIGTNIFSPVFNFDTPPVTK